MVNTQHEENLDRNIGKAESIPSKIENEHIIFHNQRQLISLYSQMFIRKKNHSQVLAPLRLPESAVSNRDLERVLAGSVDIIVHSVRNRYIWGRFVDRDLHTHVETYGKAVVLGPVLLAAFFLTAERTRDLIKKLPLVTFFSSALKTLNDDRKR